jgi:hypothetical protein
MAKILLREKHACYNHPHRKTNKRCDRCGTVYCEECLTARDERNFCSQCTIQYDAIQKRRQRPFKEKLKDVAPRRSSVYFTIGFFVLIVLVAGIIGRQLASVTLEPEEAARVARAFRGTLQTTEGLNLVEAIVGGQVVSYSSEQVEGDHVAKRLVDGWADTKVPDWRSENAVFPQEFVLAIERQVLAGGQAFANTLTLQTNEQSPPESWPREFQLFVSTESADGPWEEVGTFTVAESTLLQRFSFESLPVWYVKIVILSNHGSTEYTSLAEVGVYLTQ